MKADTPPVDKTSAAGRPRDPRLDAAILTATADLLVEIGYANVTMAAIAERAGTTKTALYRRWSGKAELVHELAFSRMARLPPSSGDVATDLATLVSAASELFASPVTRAALPGLITDMSSDASLARRVHAGFGEVFGALRERLVVAVANGEVHPDVDPDRLIEVIGGAAMLHALMLGDSDFDDAWPAALTAIVMHGVLRPADGRPTLGT